MSAKSLKTDYFETFLTGFGEFAPRNPPIAKKSPEKPVSVQMQILECLGGDSGQGLNLKELVECGLGEPSEIVAALAKLEESKLVEFDGTDKFILTDTGKLLAA